MISDLLFRLRALFRRPTVERELDEELEAHVAHEAEKLVSSGLSEKDAVRQARLNFGGLTQIQEECRDARGVTFLETTAADVRYALRGMRRSPAHTLTAILTLALGAGAVSTALTLGNTLLFRRLPVEAPDELVVIQATRRQGTVPGWVSYPDYTQFRAARTMQDLAGHYSTAPLYVSLAARSQEVSGAVVSANFFPLLNLRPRLGRFFGPEEDRVPDRDRVAVVSTRFWREWLGESGDLSSTAIKINGVVFSVIGVVPERFQGLLPVPNEIYIPTMMTRTGYRFCKDALASDCTVYSMIGRLRPGVTIEKARDELQRLTPASWSQAREGENTGVTVYPARGVLDPNRSRSGEVRFSALLAGVSIVLLLICCVNLAGLQIARNDTRVREFEIRASLGAGAGRITRQLLTESLVLAVVGGLAGLCVSLLLGGYLQSSFYTLDSAGRPLHYDVTPDFNVTIAVLGISSAAGFLLGIYPALRAAWTSGQTQMRDRSAGATRQPLGYGLAGVQTAFAVALAVVAGLLMVGAHGVLGGRNFDPSHVALMRLRPRLVQYTPAKAQSYLRNVMQTLEAMPAVESATLVGNGVALLGGSAKVSLPGSPDSPAEAGHVLIGPRYFETLKTPLLQGREFGSHDNGAGPPVAVVNEVLARQIGKQGSVIGATVLVNQRAHRVVGVAANVELQSRSEVIEPYIFTPFWQNPAMVDARLCIRVKGDPAAIVPSLARAVNQVDPDVPVTETVTLRLQLEGSIRALRLTATFVAYAALLAIGLSVLGLYGVLAFSVQRRSKEMGIRMAIGARPAELVAMVVREGMAVILSGAALGLCLAMGAAGLVRHLLYGSGSSDAAIYVTAALLVVTTGLFACSIPAWRAATVEPLRALRED
jgi:predicted permease